MTFRHSFITVACVLSLFGCTKQQAGQKEKPKDSSPVIAEVNGSTITKDQFEAELKNLPPQLQVIAESQDGKKQLLEQLILRKIVSQEARKSGLDKSKEVEERIEDLKEKVLVDAFLKKRLDEKITISDDELKKVYAKYSDQFKHPEQIRASHILVKTEKEAQDILAQLKGGAKFEEMAAKHSTDNVSAKGGDLGWFGKQTMLPDFERAAFALKEGETSGVVKTRYGFHLIKATGKRPAGITPFEEVKDKIKAALMPGKQQEVLQKVKEELLKGAKVTIKDPMLAGPIQKDHDEKAHSTKDKH